MSDSYGSVSAGDSVGGSSDASAKVDTAKQEAADLKDTATAGAKDVLGTAKEEASSVVGEAKVQAKDLYAQTQRELKDQAGVQQQREVALGDVVSLRRIDIRHRIASLSNRSRGRPPGTCGGCA